MILIAFNFYIVIIISVIIPKYPFVKDTIIQTYVQTIHNVRYTPT